MTTEPELLGEPKPRDRWEFIDAAELPTDPYGRGEVLIDGLLRRGEVLLIGSQSKIGKSWLSLQMAHCLAAGLPVLGRTVTRSRVLFVDTELTQGEFCYRTKVVADALRITPKPEKLLAVIRRGRDCSVEKIRELVRRIGRTPDIVFIDSSYKTFGDRNENDNSQMGEVMNVMQSIARENELGLIAVMHAPKGDLSQRSTLDVFSGAGSFGRSLDAAIVIREHALEGLAVCEFRCRSFAPSEPVSLSFDWPLWAISPEAANIKRPKTKQGFAQADRDAEGKAAILGHLALGGCSASMVRTQTGIGLERVNRLLPILEAEGLVRRTPILDEGKKLPDCWTLAEPACLPEETDCTLSDDGSDLL